MRADLVDLEGGLNIPLRRRITVAGRQEDCDLRIAHASVSKLHCVLVKGPDVLAVRDLLSTNGTRVNGQQVARALLLPGDILEIGSRRFRVVLGPDEKPKEAGAGPSQPAD